MLTVIKCGTCENVMAAFHDADDAHETAAYVTGSYCSESGEYECAECNHNRYMEGMRLSRDYDLERRFAQAMQDDQDWRDSILDRADSIFDAARDRGEI